MIEMSFQSRLNIMNLLCFHIYHIKIDLKKEYILLSMGNIQILNSQFTFTLIPAIIAAVKQRKVKDYTLTLNKYSLRTMERANCNKKIPATIKNHLSPADTMWFLRFCATNNADMIPATPVITHLNISTGTTDRHCNQPETLSIRTLSYTWCPLHFYKYNWCVKI